MAAGKLLHAVDSRQRTCITYHHDQIVQTVVDGRKALELSYQNSLL